MNAAHRSTASSFSSHVPSVCALSLRQELITQALLARPAWQGLWANTRGNKPQAMVAKRAISRSCNYARAVWEWTGAGKGGCGGRVVCFTARRLAILTRCLDVWVVLAVWCVGALGGTAGRVRRWCRAAMLRPVPRPHTPAAQRIEGGPSSVCSLCPTTWRPSLPRVHLAAPVIARNPLPSARP